MKALYRNPKVTNKSPKTISSRAILLLLAIVISTGDYLFGQSRIVFSENFDNATSIQPWPYSSTGWINKSTNSLQSVSGRGKVLHINYAAGSVGSDHGLGNYRIPLDSAYKEMYLSWDYYLPGHYDFGMADGHGGGKFFGGFAGGSMTAIPNNDATDNDGWVSILMFQNGNFSTYNYFKGSSFSSGGWPFGVGVGKIYKGEWRNITVRLKINDGDTPNGIFEIFENGILIYQLPNAKIVNSAHPEYLIEHLYLNSFFGGSGPEYVSPINQYAEFDNITAFYYPQGTSGYRSGLSETGRKLDIPKAISYHPAPPNRFIPTTYTQASGKIESHCGYYQPVDQLEYSQTSTIQVTGASSININVTKFNFDRGTAYAGYQQILKIYQGTGSGKVLKKTFQNGVNTTLGSVDISGSSATIEWQAGQGTHNGFTINYTSNGTGSGKNIVCSSCIAEQGKGVTSLTPTVSIPATPTNLSFSGLTDRSLSLNWTDNSTNETSFEIEMSKPDLTTVQYQSGSNTTTYACSGLTGHTTYSYRIRAMNTAGYSGWSNSIQVTTNYALPNPPTDLAGTAQTSNSISLKWTDNSGIEDGFKLERSTSATGVFAEIATVSANITTYKDNALNPSTAYYYKLRAFNTAGNTNYTAVASVSTSATSEPAIANNAPVINNQSFSVVEGNLSDFTIGIVVSNDPDPNQQLSYSILSGNTAGLFAIDAKTGELKVTDDKIFGIGSITHQIVIQVTDNAQSPKNATASITITVTGNSKTVYIDPDNTQDLLANGSVYHPYDSWSDISWKEGYSYLQKRGTTITLDKLLIGANNVKLGAYGEGDRPIISSATNTYLISGFEKSGIKISSLNIQAGNASSCIYFLGSTTDTIMVDHCLLTGNENAIKVVDGTVLITKYNRISSEQDGIFSTAKSNEIVYNIFENCQAAVNIMSNESEARLYNNVFVDNTKSVAVSYAELTLYNNIFYLETPGQVAIDQEEGTLVSDNNIYYPEQDGFIAIANKFYDRLNELQQEMNVDLNSFNTDPEFNDLYGSDFTIKQTSPAINAGKTLDEGFDMLGNKVPLFSKTDIGVFEFNGELNLLSNPEKTSTLSVFPNPSSGQVSILAIINEPQTTKEPVTLETPELEIIDISGKQIYSKFIDINNSNSFQDRLDLSEFSNGLYFIVIKFADKVLKEKLIISR